MGTKIRAVIHGGGEEEVTLLQRHGIPANPAKR
jgi:hypothetical protein